MAGYPDPTEPLGPVGPGGGGPVVPPRPAPRINGARLWSAGLATAVVAALVALVGVLIVRALLRIDLYAPRAAGAFGSSVTVVLCLGAAVAALVATGLAHLLLLSTPRPLAYLSWIIGLVTAAAVVLPFTYSSSLAVAVAQAVIHLVIGIAIGSLVTGAAGSALRSAALGGGRPYDVE
jgi:Family of unknown function (DUF6069)